MRPTPTTAFDPRYSSDDASATPWHDAEARLAAAELSWLTTVRTDGRPHVTPLLAVWDDGAPHFCTGPDERKARNLETNPHCVLTTGTDAWADGVDVVVEGRAERVTDDATLHRLADAWVAKYGDGWRFDVKDGAFRNDQGGIAYVFRLVPTTAFAFAKAPHGQTRYRFNPTS